MQSADIDDLFAATQWSEFADISIKLPTEPLSPDDLWDETAEISFIPNETSAAAGSERKRQ